MPQVIPELHTRYLFKFTGCVELGISQAAGQIAKRQRFVLIIPDASVDFIDDYLNLLLPFVHSSALPFNRSVSIIGKPNNTRLILLAVFSNNAPQRPDLPPLRSGSSYRLCANSFFITSIKYRSAPSR